MRSTSVYLAGPMRGYPEYNFPLFFKVTEKLESLGFIVHNPAARDIVSDGFNPKKDQAKELKHYMYYDLPMVCTSDMLVVLPNWEFSQGARLEVHVANECKIPVYPVELLLNGTIKGV